MSQTVESRNNRTTDSDLEELIERIVGVLAKLSNVPQVNQIDSTKAALLACASTLVQQRLQRSISELNVNDNWDQLRRIIDPETLADMKEEIALDILLGRKRDNCSSTSTTLNRFEIESQIASANQTVEHALGSQSAPEKSNLLASEGGLLDLVGFAKVLGTSESTIKRKYSKGELLGVKPLEGRTSKRLYPAWQIVDGVLLKGVADLKAAFDNDDLRAIRFMLLPNARLEGNARPLDYVREGMLDRVLELVSVSA